jgi:hypothetical protein
VGRLAAWTTKAWRGRRTGPHPKREILRAGKALANNMDLLDLWKCHICREAHHLFLVVPFLVKRRRA